MDFVRMPISAELIILSFFGLHSLAAAAAAADQQKAMI